MSLFLLANLSGWACKDVFAHEKGHNSGYFVPNEGQWPNEVHAMYEMPGSRVFVTDFGMRIVSSDQKSIREVHDTRNFDLPVRGSFYDMRLKGGKLHHMLKADSLAVRLNFFLGKDPGKWKSDIHPVQQLTFPDVYPGIDLVFHNDDEAVKYEFVIHPGANPAAIAWEVSGAAVSLSKRGDLTYKTTFGQMQEEKPYIYEQLESGTREVAGGFLLAGSEISFKTGKYNKRKTLVIDPRLIFATFTGSTSDNWGFTATSDSVGNGYLGGVCEAPGYPISTSAFDFSYNGGRWDMVISKFSANGQQLLYSTYIGGNDNEYPLSMVTNANEELIILGKARSADYPVLATAYDPFHKGAFDLVLTKLNVNGSALLGSTFVGGSGNDGHNRSALRNAYQADTTALEYNYGDDSRGEVLLDGVDNVYVASNTHSGDFPVLNALQSVKSAEQDAVVFKMNASLTTMLWSTFLGGNADDAAYGLAIAAPANSVYVTGGTKSPDFLSAIAAPGYDAAHNGQNDGWVVHLGPNGNTLLGKTFLGTTANDQSFLIQLDAQQRVYVAGQSRGNMPVSSQQLYHHTGAKQFLQRYNTGLTSLELATVLGPVNASAPSMSPTALLVDLCDRIYLAGWGGASNAINTNLGSWPVTANAFQANTDGSDFYFAVLDSGATGLLYASYFGGTAPEHVDGGTSRFNRQGVVYQAVCAGCPGNSSFPVTQDAYSLTNNSGNCNAAIFKFDLEIFRPVAAFSTQYPDTPVCQSVPVLFQNTGTSNASYFWDFGVPGATSTLPSPSYTYTNTGIYLVTLIVSNCVGSDTITRNVNVLPPPVLSLSGNAVLCPGDTIAVSVQGGTAYRWQQVIGLLDTTGSSPRFVGPGDVWLYVTVYNAAGCELFDSIFVQNSPEPVVLPASMTTCLGGSLQLSPALGPEVGGFSWLPDPWIADTMQAVQVVTPLESRWLYYRTTDTSGCTFIDSMLIQLLVSVIAQAGPDRFICVNHTDTLKAQGGTSYLWSTGETTSSILIPHTAAGLYWVIAYIDSCRSHPDTVFVRLNDVEANFTFSPDTGYAPAQIQFTNLSTGEGVREFHWDFGDGYTSAEVSPGHIYRKPGTYTARLTATNPQSGCTDSMDYNYIYIDSIQILLPNAFTPNNDGINDRFEFVHRNFESFEVLIYNRWGQLVFQSQHPSICWDGRFQNEQAPAGAYPYLIKAVGKNRKPYHFEGEVVLIR